MSEIVLGGHLDSFVSYLKKTLNALIPVTNGSLTASMFSLTADIQLAEFDLQLQDSREDLHR